MTDYEASARVLLRPEVTEEQVEDVSLDLGWVVLGSRVATDTTPYEQVWQDENAAVYVHFVWDDLLALAFLLLHGGDVPTVERKVRAALPTYTYDEVLTELRSATDGAQLTDSIFRLAVLRPAEDPEVIELLQRAAGSKDAAVRRCVVHGVSYLEWPALLTLIADLRENDPDQTVREDAALVLDAIAEAPSDKP
jgi:hypothetical protein